MPDPLNVSCPNCRKAMTVPAEVSGKKIRCKECQTVFVAGAAVAAGPRPGTAAPVAKKVDPPKETFGLAPADAPKPGTAKPAKRAVAKAVVKPAEAAKPPVDVDDDGNPYGIIKDDSEVPRCPFCAIELDPPDTQICMNCGYDMMARKRHETRRVYGHTTGDYVRHHMGAVGLTLFAIALLAFNITCWIYMRSWFEGSFLEDDDEDPFRPGKKKLFLPPNACNLFIFVPSMFVVWKCGEFAVKRFFINYRPVEVLKKQK